MFNNEYICTYTRTQAIEDGILINVDERISREAGITVPVAITCTVYERFVYWTDKDSVRQTYQDQSGRLWDILWMCAQFLRTSARKGIKNNGTGLLFELRTIPRNESSRAKYPKNIILKVVLGVGDNFEPVITIMMPDED